jgi:hypothetical protein
LSLVGRAENIPASTTHGYTPKKKKIFWAERAYFVKNKNHLTTTTSSLLKKFNLSINLRCCRSKFKTLLRGI